MTGFYIRGHAAWCTSAGKPAEVDGRCPLCAFVGVPSSRGRLRPHRRRIAFSTPTPPPSEADGPRAPGG